MEEAKKMWEEGIAEKKLKKHFAGKWVSHIKRCVLCSQFQPRYQINSWSTYYFIIKLSWHKIQHYYGIY